MTIVTDFACQYSVLASLREAGFPRDRIHKAMSALYDDDPADTEPDDDSLDAARELLTGDDDDPSHMPGEEPIDWEPCPLYPEDQPYEPTPEDLAELARWSAEVEQRDRDFVEAMARTDAREAWNQERLGGEEPRIAAGAWD